MLETLLTPAYYLNESHDTLHGHPGKFPTKSAG